MVQALGVTSIGEDALLVNPSGVENAYSWATVTDVSPLAIQLDGDSAPLPSPPDSLVAGLVAGSRVWCQLYRRRVIVLGSAQGGGTATELYVDDRERTYTTESTSVSWNNVTVPGTHNRLMNGSTNANGPGPAAYYYLTNYVYGPTEGVPLVEGHTNNLTQWATPYGSYGQPHTPVYRFRYSNVWGPWKTILSDAYMPTPMYRGICATTTLANATVVTLSAWTTYNYRDVSRSGGTFTLQQAGVWAITLTGQFSVAADANDRNFLTVVLPGGRFLRNNVGISDSIMSVSGVYGFNADDTFQCQAYQTNGVSQTLSNVSLHAAKVSDI